MGCKDSRFYDNNEKVQSYRYQFEALQLQESEIANLYTVYRLVDVDNSGTIEVNELLAHIDVDKTKFTERIFSIFDEDRSGQIDFRGNLLFL